MQKIHGSVAKLVNDVLPARIVPFWRTAGNKDYFDGCIRDEQQASRAYRYTLNQAVRAGIVRDWRDYPHTRMIVSLNDALALAKKRELICPKFHTRVINGTDADSSRGLVA